MSKVHKLKNLSRQITFKLFVETATNAGLISSLCPEILLAKQPK